MDTERPQPDDLRPRCLCCDRPATVLHIGRHVCFDCYESGKLLDCLAAEMARNMVTPAAPMAHGGTEGASVNRKLTRLLRGN